MTNKKGFSLIKMILVCLLIAFCIFLVMLLIARAKKTGCNDTNNSNSVFNNNMMYLQQVGTDFFTDDRLPSQLGETIKISLAELYEKKYALDITDKDGKSCSKEDSYVSVTKTERGYEMKTFLVCGTDSDYSIKDIVPCVCESACTCKPIVEYEFMKKVTKEVTTYSCPKGYKLNGKKCTITKLTDSIKPTIVSETKTDTKDAHKVVVAGTKRKVNTVITTKETTADKITVVITPERKEKVDVNPIKTRTTTDVLKKTNEVCKEVTETKPGCTVQCKTVIENGVPKTVCNSCKITYLKCTTNSTWYCPSGYTQSGSGSSSTCYKDTWACPSNISSANQSGSGANLKCWYYKTIPAVTETKCPDGYKLTNNKCVKTTTSYSCPSESNYSEGSGANLKCYVVTSATFSYNCDGMTGYSLSGSKCIKKTVTQTKTCPKNYKLESGKCNKYNTITKNAEAKKIKKTITELKWSTKETLSGWTRTGKTREVPNKACNK